MTLPDIQRNDIVRLEVPRLRTLEPGSYTMRVFAAERVNDGIRLVLARQVGKATVYVQLLITNNPRLAGYAFIGKDQYPVPYRWEQDLRERLRKSVDYAQRDKRTDQS